MMALTYNNIYMFLRRVWNAETLPTDIVVHLCFMVVSSFAFFFFTLLAEVMTRDYIVVTPNSIDTVNYLLSWSNVCLNLLFALIILEISQVCVAAYENYMRDNL